MLDGGFDLSVLLEPRGGPGVQRWHDLGLLDLDLVAKHGREQRVVAVRIAALERDEEQVGPLQLLQHRGGALRVEDRVAEGSGEAFEYRGAEKEPTLLGRKGLEHVVSEIVEDASAVSGEGGNERGRVVVLEDEDQRQVERRHPALGAVVQPAGIVGVEHDVGSREELGRLGVAEAKLVGTYLQELVVRTEPGEWEARVRAGRDDDLHHGRDL